MQLAGLLVNSPTTMDIRCHSVALYYLGPLIYYPKGGGSQHNFRQACESETRLQWKAEHPVQFTPCSNPQAPSPFESLPCCLVPLWLFCPQVLFFLTLFVPFRIMSLITPVHFLFHFSLTV